MKVQHTKDGIFVDGVKVKDLETAREMYQAWKSVQPKKEEYVKKGPRKYRLVAVPDKKLSPQQGLILNAISSETFQSTEEITNTVVESGQLITVQDPKRVVGFYIVEWVKEGFLERAA